MDLITIFFFLILLGVLSVVVAYFQVPILQLKKGWSYHPLGYGMKRTAHLCGPEVVPLSSISRPFLVTLLANEDRDFFSHKGFDFTEIRIAIADFLFRGQRLRGASTISQQLMKNFFLTSNRSLRRKFWEAMYTVRLERSFDKDSILTLYLNNIEWGREIYGIRAACRYYFSKSPRELTEVESVLLATIVPRPRAIDREFRSKQFENTTMRSFRAVMTYFLELKSDEKVSQFLYGGDFDLIKKIDLKAIQFGDNESSRQAALERRARVRPISARITKDFTRSLFSRSKDDYRVDTEPIDLPLSVKQVVLPERFELRKFLRGFFLKSLQS